MPFGNAVIQVSLSHLTRALMKMDSDSLLSPAAGLAEEEEADMDDWKLPLAFMKKRHCEKIEGSKALAQSWRMKDRETAANHRPPPPFITAPIRGVRPRGDPSHAGTGEPSKRRAMNGRAAFRRS
ncbi:Regulatory-associated protein of mTOR [Liparis tanakae]|uniref:Regulatory-associated protein of mTOR n=1 Tax=Liparis tanakae TaxID=230148 RepID=A0A4Z2F6M9_9TELE|nr:Regulatory-associated protein of mTOR [Liparis tanakae]